MRKRDRLPWPTAVVIIMVLSPLCGVALASCAALLFSVGGLR